MAVSRLCWSFLCCFNHCFSQLLALPSHPSSASSSSRPTLLRSNTSESSAPATSRVFLFSDEALPPTRPSFHFPFLPRPRRHLHRPPWIEEGSSRERVACPSDNAWHATLAIRYVRLTRLSQDSWANRVCSSLPKSHILATTTCC